jgi:serine/threonine protein phosphatase PrpC
MGHPAARFAGGSDLGRVRTNNEDAWHGDLERGVFLVVDGMGGQAAGEKAAEIAVARVRARLERRTGTAEQRLREAITMANNEILRAAESRPEWRGMACVLTVAVVEDGYAVVGHVGDSRLYQVRRGEIRKITRDHSPVGEREDQGELSEFEAMRHPRRNEVFRDVGSEERSPDDPDFIEIERVPFAADSALVLCSDGLSDLVPSNRIRAAVEGHAGHPEEAVKQLIEEANAAGGTDNVTVVVVEGEMFGQAAASPRRGALAGRAAMFVYGAVLAAGTAFGVYWFNKPAPVKPPRVPAVLKVGQHLGFSTITEAMDAAQPGDTVEVWPGDYFEQVRLKSGVKLSSWGPYDAELHAAPLSRGPAVIADKVQGARITGFRIVADAQKPLTAGILVGDADVEVSEVEIQGAGVGIEIRGSGNVTLVANTIEDCLAEGVLITGHCASQWISHNVFRRNKGAAISAHDGAPVLDGNVFDKATLDLPPVFLNGPDGRGNLFLEIRPVPAAAPRKKP